MFEAMALWEDEDYAVRLGELIALLAPIEKSVIAAATNHVDSLLPGWEETAEDTDHDILFAPLDTNAPDPTNDAYQAAKNNILKHLRPKIRMD